MPTAIEVKSEILARSSDRKRENVEAVWRVLEAMYAKGVRVFRIVDVGLACEEAGIFKEQSIRNAGGADYRALITAFAVDAGAATVHAPRIARSPIEAAIDTIKDLDIRTKLKAMVAENRKQLNEINRLKEAFKTFRPVEARAPEPQPSLASEAEVMPPGKKRVDLVPLEKFISSEWLDDNQWHVDQNGAIYDANGDRLTPVGFVPALSAAMKVLSAK